MKVYISRGDEFHLHELHDDDSAGYGLTELDLPEDKIKWVKESMDSFYDAQEYLRKVNQK